LLTLWLGLFVGKICNDELENTTKSFEAQPDGEDASAHLSASAAVLTRTDSGSNNDRTSNPLAQLGYLPDHLESAVQNEVSDTDTFKISVNQG
jgi:hypothetical protein